MLGASGSTEQSGDIRVVNDTAEVLVHSKWKRASSSGVEPAASAPREESAIKPVFDVPSLTATLAIIEAAGGALTTLSFTYEGLTRHDVIDPDGNVIQLRSRAD